MKGESELIVFAKREIHGALQEQLFGRDKLKFPALPKGGTNREQSGSAEDWGVIKGGITKEPEQSEILKKTELPGREAKK